MSTVRCGRQKGVQPCLLHERQVIGLVADGTAGPGDRPHRAPVVVARPVRIGDRVAMGPAPRLRRVDSGADDDAVRGGDHQAVGPPEGAIEKARIIGDVVHRGKQAGGYALALHVLAQERQARVVFPGRERQGLVALVEAVEFGTVHVRSPEKAPPGRGGPGGNGSGSRRSGGFGRVSGAAEPRRRHRRACVPQDGPRRR
jgi:hypothetical protein